MSANQLHRETSPYLLQHQDNPVHWLPWGPEAFARARAENRPVLLSIGYAACHWCHVMAHESFEKPETAAVMNRLFVNIKLDREERPDIDQIYQAALSALGQSGGWPLTMFLTPDGEPFWGGTYFPPTARYGRPGFVEVLEGVAAAYGDDHQKIMQNVAALRQALERLADNRAGRGIGIGALDHVAERLAQEVDPFHGGIGSAPKFPQVPIFELFWRAWLRGGKTSYRDAVLNTLTHMCQGGIYDHLGGGFARYSVDDRWLAPHFEKMLYDNAQLLRLLTLVWQDSRQPLFARRAEETVFWLLREMIAPGGGFAATLDADSEGEEGRYYVWDEAEIDRLLGEDASFFKLVYDVSGPGNWEEKNILNRLGRLTLLDDAEEQRLELLRHTLMAARDPRPRPGWDDKVLADWNGLMIAGLTEAAMAFGRPDWLAVAQRAFLFIVDHMMRDDRLYHVWRRDTLKHLATADDLAHMAQAGLALYDATSDTAYLERARQWLMILDDHHWDSRRGGYFLTADDAGDNDGAPVICRIKTAHDSSTPSANGALAGVLARFYAVTGEARWRERAEALVAAFAGELARNFFPLPTLLNGVETLHQPLHIVLATARPQDHGGPLERALYQCSLPDRMVTRVVDGAALPADHPAHGKTSLNGAPTAYVCRGPQCAAPVTDPAALTALLKE